VAAARALPIDPPVTRLDPGKGPRWGRLASVFRPPADETSARDPGFRPPGGAPRIVALEARLAPAAADGTCRLALPLVPVVAGDGAPWRLRQPFFPGLENAIAAVASGEEDALAPAALTALVDASGFGAVREPGYADRAFLAPACIAFAYAAAGETLAAHAAGRIDAATAAARTLGVVAIEGADDADLAEDVALLGALVAADAGG